MSRWLLIRLFHGYFPIRTFVLGVSEACLIALSFVAASIVRLGTNDATLMLRYEQGLLKIVLLSAAFSICMYYFDLYDSSILSDRREVFGRLVQVLGTMCILVAVVYFLYPHLELGRGIILIGLLIVVIILAVWRGLFFALNDGSRFAERVLIFGDGPLAESLIAELGARPELGLQVVGQVKSHENKNSSFSFGDDRDDRFSNLIETYNPKRIVVAMDQRRGNLPVESLFHLKSQGVRIQEGAELYEAATGKLPIESLRLSWLLFSPGAAVSRPVEICKLASSVICSTLGLILSTPLMVLIALAIRLDSHGPAILRQKRVGLNGKIFTLFKFRTMMNGVDQEENHRPAERTDSRFTRLGKVLRRTHMDELPQLFNILRGDMHFVGPRPFVPNQEQECLEKIPYYRQRWVVKPGATGWAQVNRGYNATIEDNTDKLAYDLFYIKNLSVTLDLLILFKTVKILILGHGGQ
jgi:exopolysaccharide biosynthesis polyprenyl glycosylphosphotransferase